jgi:hypothetical protein
MPRHPPNALNLLENGPCNTDERNRSPSHPCQINRNGLLYKPVAIHPTPIFIGDARNLFPGPLDPGSLTQRDTAFQDPRRSRCRHVLRRTSHQRGLVPEGLYHAGHTSIREQTRSRTPGILCKSSSVSGVARQNLAANASIMMRSSEDRSSSQCQNIHQRQMTQRSKLRSVVCLHTALRDKNGGPGKT